MIELAVLIVLLILVLGVVAYLLGLSVGINRVTDASNDIGASSSDAIRQVHELTHRAFVAMKEQARSPQHE